MSEKHLWGIDLGGTKIEGIVLKSSLEPEVLIRKRIDTDSHLGYDHIIDQVSSLISFIEEELKISPDKVGFGTPGVLDPSMGVMKNCNTTSLNGKPLKHDLEKALGVDVKLANDANCLALAETRMGIVATEVPDARVTFGVIMGTGVGGGVVVDGKVLEGKQGIAGEWGHNFLDESGGKCYCGKIGCVEKVISGRNLELHHKEKFGVEKKLKDIYQEHLNGSSKECSYTINRLISYFGKAISTVINILDPDAIVIGGGVGNIDLLYTQGVEEVRKHIFNSRLDTRFLKPQLGDSAGVFGAAYLVS